MKEGKIKSRLDVAREDVREYFRNVDKILASGSEQEYVDYCAQHRKKDDVAWELAVLEFKKEEGTSPFTRDDERTMEALQEKLKEEETK